MTGQEAIAELAQLQPGWDSYQGMPIDQRVLAVASVMVDMIARRLLPDPSIVPCGDGSAQFEWHSLGWDIELSIAYAPGHGPPKEPDWTSTQCVTRPEPGVVYVPRSPDPGKAKGGHVRAAKLSPKRRSEIARQGAAARWAKR